MPKVGEEPDQPAQRLIHLLASCGHARRGRVPVWCLVHLDALSRRAPTLSSLGRKPEAAVNARRSEYRQFEPSARRQPLAALVPEHPAIAPFENGGGERAAVASAGVKIDAIAVMLWRAQRGVPVYHKPTVITRVLKKRVSNPQQVFCVLIGEGNARHDPGMNKKKVVSLVRQRQGIKKGKVAISLPKRPERGADSARLWLCHDALIDKVADEGATLAQLAVDLQIAPMTGHQMLDDCQAKTGAATLA